MGKSPGKWIKTVLFGKKTARSNSVKGRNASKSGIDKGYAVSKGPPASTENSPVISEPVLVSTHDSGVNRELEKGNSSNLGADTSPIVPTIQGHENQGIAGHVESHKPEKLREEHAAIKAQAVFRGFLARRAFRALKGIIKLQALVRGHLVRRQAIVTLLSTLGLIKFQALVRGQKVRSSGLGLEVSTKFLQGKTVVSKRLDSRNDKLYSHVFVCKLLSSSLVVMPLQILYDQSEPNSVFSWMERWTFSHFWKPPSEPKKTVESKPQPRRGGYAMETESGRSKRSVRRNSPANVDTISSNLPTDPEKLKRNVKKATASADSVQDHPQSELEKVKRNLRKVASSYAETIDRSQVGIDTKKEVSLILEPSDSPQEGFDDSSEKTKKEVALTPEPEPVMETASKSITTEGQTDQLVDNPPALESNPLPSIDKEENVSVMNGELSVKEEDQDYSENQNNNKRRASFSAKSEYAENGVQNTPKVPSYMQATESAKAKLRGQNSPRFGSDSAEKNSAEKNGSARRHSLPSSTNGKVTSNSPRTQKILLASGKGGIRSDRSLLSSRDGNEKPIVEWRR